LSKLSKAVRSQPKPQGPLHRRHPDANFRDQVNKYRLLTPKLVVGRPKLAHVGSVRLSTLLLSNMLTKVGDLSAECQQPIDRPQSPRRGVELPRCHPPKLKVYRSIVLRGVPLLELPVDAARPIGVGKSQEVMHGCIGHGGNTVISIHLPKGAEPAAKRI
jgi:hypothetical protein